MDNGIDFPTNGSWGLTDSQWHERKTEYEKVLDERDSMKEFADSAERREQAGQTLLLDIEEYLALYDGMLTLGEQKAFERMTAFLNTKMEAAKGTRMKARTQLQNLEHRIKFWLSRR